jgi:D-xylose transport system substrate-binding protein
MGLSKRALAGASAMAMLAASLVSSGAVVAQDESPAAAESMAAVECNVGVSWNNFEQPRWAATDKPNMQATIEAGGGTYTDFDAKLDSAQQLTDVETLINGGADVLVLLAQDQDAAVTAIEAANNAGVPIIAYDRLIEDPGVLYITFDNVGVGRAEAEAILGAVPSGNYVLIKGDPGDPNASTFLPQGWTEAGLDAAVEAGDITIIADQFTDGWRTETAQDNMEAIIDAAAADGVEINAILAENDSTALGVVGALQAKGLDPIPLSGQDGDPANLQNVAAGWQYVDVWKNSNELGKVAGAAALQLCAGTPIGEVTIPEGLIDASVAPLAGPAAADFTTPGGNVVKSIILQPTPVTQDNLNLVVDSGWIAQDVLCAQATDPAIAAPICAE